MDAAIFIEQPVTRKHFVNVREKSSWSGNIAHTQEISDSLNISFSSYQRVTQQGLDLRSKEKSASHAGVVERFFACTVSRQEETFACSIPDGEAEHAMEVSHALYTIFFVGVNYRLRVAVRMEAMSFLNQCFAHRLVISDLAIEDDPDISCFIAHWLMSTTQIDNAQTSKAQSERT